MVDWDEDKRKYNLVKHGLDFAEIERFQWESAVGFQDVRKDYGETRFSATGLIGDRLHVVIYTERPNGIRLISLRKANTREIGRWTSQQ